MKYNLQFATLGPSLVIVRYTDDEKMNLGGLIKKRTRPSAKKRFEKKKLANYILRLLSVKIIKLFKNLRPFLANFFFRIIFLSTSILK